jgi:hypothetical protein
MKLFLRAHRAVPVFAAGAGLMVVAWWLAGSTLPVPQLMQGRAAPVAVEMLLTVLYAPLIAYGFGGVALRVEHGNRRSLLGPDLCLTALAGAPVLAVVLLAAATGDAGFGANLGRDAMAFIGGALVLLTVFGESAAVAVPVLYFFVASLLGSQPDGSAQWWAVLRAPATPATVVLAFVLLAAGVLAYHLRARPAAGQRVSRV